MRETRSTRDFSMDICTTGIWKNLCVWLACAEPYPHNRQAAQTGNPLSKKQCNMYLDEIVQAQKRGEAKGIPSVCSAHPYVIRQTLRVLETLRVSPLIEATCNQVNQFFGYTGMTPNYFTKRKVDFLRDAAHIRDEIIWSHTCIAAKLVHLITCCLNQG